jgi:hypothetical protein
MLNRPAGVSDTVGSEKGRPNVAMETEIEERLAAVEKVITGLQEQLMRLSPHADWVDRISGSFEDEPEFEQVLAYGRVLRSASRLAENADERA